MAQLDARPTGDQEVAGSIHAMTPILKMCFELLFLKGKDKRLETW